MRAPRKSAALPHFLQHGGNAKAWETVAASLRQTPSRVILLHGPTGVGKTRGVYDVAMHHLGITVFELNAASVNSTDDLRQRLSHVTKCKTLFGTRLALLDDIEGFDETYISTAVKLIKSRTSTDGPMVLTCINPYDRCLVPLRELPLTRIRMYAPPTKVMVKAMAHIHTAAPSVLTMHAEQSIGNYHQLALRLNTFINSKPDAHVGLFETSHALLKGTADVETWSRSAEPQVLTHLIHENYLAWSNTADDAHDVADLLSRCERFDEPRKLECIGRMLFSQCRSATVPQMTLSRQQRLSDTTFSAVDMPSLLRSAA